MSSASAAGNTLADTAVRKLFSKAWLIGEKRFLFNWTLATILIPSGPKCVCDQMKPD